MFQPSTHLLHPAAFLLLAVVPSLQEESEEPPAHTYPREHLEVASPSGDLKLAIEVTTIGLIDPQVPPESMRVSPDGRHVAYVSMESGSVIVYSDGVPGTAFEGFQPESLAFAPNGTLCYMGVRGKKSYVVVGDREFKFGRISTAGIRFSKDGSRFAFVGRRSGDYFAVVDGEEYGPYRGMSRQPIKLSQDNEHFGFIAKIGKTTHAVIDGEPGPGYEAITAIRFGPEGRHTSYIAKNGETWIPVLDGKELGEFDEIRDPVFDFAANGTRPGLIVRKGERWHVLLDGELGPGYSDVRNLSISQDGTSTAYLARREAGSTPILVLNGEEMDGSFSKLTFSPTGGRWGVVRGGKGRQSVVIGDVEGPEYDAIQPPGVVFSDDGAHALYVAVKDGQRVVVVDGEESAPFEKLGETKPTFLPESANHFYSIASGEHEILVLNGKRSRPYEEVSHTAFGAGGRVACAARVGTGRWVVYVDGEELGPDDESPALAGDTYFTARHPVFDPRGERLAYSIWTLPKGSPGPKGHVVVDGERGPDFDDIMSGIVTFSPDGEHVVYASGTADERFLVVDDTRVPGYHGFMRSHGIQFGEDGRAYIICMHQTRIVRLDIDIQG